MTTATDVKGLQTEGRNPRSTNIDNVNTLELCQIINNEDKTIADIVKGCIPTIANAIDALVPRVRQGGRVIYVGAGTSGRLGVLDASEIPPTYSAPPSQFVGLIAGGDVALRSAKEGAEDSWQGAVDDLSPLNLDGEKNDALIGIASSGRTPYVLSTLAFAKSKGCVTIGIACSAPSAMSRSGHVDFMIDAVTGPEVVTGSTRMKAGTATKLILNLLSTGIMIKIGKTYGNIMVDVKPTNFKLQIRARRILREICGDRCPETDEDVDAELKACSRNVKLTAVKICLGVSIEEAARRLQGADGVLATLLKAPHTVETPVNRSTSAAAEYVLCVDGGGTKCNAVLMSNDGAVGHGESGPCNPTDVGIQGAVSAIQLGIRGALDSCNSTRGRAIQELRLAEAWIGVAGGDREAIGSRIRAEVMGFLSPQTDMTLSITNDIKLLAVASSHQFKSDDVIVLVAGTGSIAMRFRREGDEFRRVARAGGWGALLGDDGSGFDIGRKAIRATLQQLEEQAYPSCTNTDSLDPLADVICQHFQPVGAETGHIGLLNDILLSASGAEQSVSETKQKIAGCAKAVIDTYKTSKRAEGIVSDAVDSILCLIRTVLRAFTLEKSTPSLMLAGGIANSDLVSNLLLKRLEKESLSISTVNRVDNPALVGAQFLARKAWVSGSNDPQ